MLADLQYSPAHQVTFVGKPGALFKGTPSVRHVPVDHKADEEDRKLAEAEQEAEAAHAAGGLPEVEHAAAAPEVHVDVGAGAADPQIKATA